jgi:hypothetical protein
VLPPPYAQDIESEKAQTLEKRVNWASQALDDKTAVATHCDLPQAPEESESAAQPAASVEDALGASAADAVDTDDLADAEHCEAPKAVGAPVLLLDDGAKRERMRKIQKCVGPGAARGLLTPALGRYLAQRHQQQSPSGKKPATFVQPRVAKKRGYRKNFNSTAAPGVPYPVAPYADSSLHDNVFGARRPFQHYTANRHSNSILDCLSHPHNSTNSTDRFEEQARLDSHRFGEFMEAWNKILAR